MKKISIAVLGLFTLVACSEDAYQEADRRTEAGVVDNNADGGIKPLTFTQGYQSPFLPSVANGGVVTTFTNNTPLFLELQPFGEDMHVQLFLSANNETYPPNGVSTYFNPIPGNKFMINPGTFPADTNSDPGAPMAVNAPPYLNSTGSIIYDFGSWTPNWRMYHHGKIYYFKYNVLDANGLVIASGYLKHKFFNDSDTFEDISNTEADWQYVTQVSGLPGYDPVVMYSRNWDEMCITNNRNYTTPPLPSSVDIVDPATSITHTLSFTVNSNGINVDFN